jgi:integrase
MTAIYVNSEKGTKTRIFSSPEEWGLVREQLNDQYRKIFDAFLHTGMRPIEARRLFSHSDWFDKTRRLVNLPKGAILKKKAKQVRTVMLTLDGAIAVEKFLALDMKGKKLPSDSAMFQALQLAADKAKIDGGSEHLSPKSFRKTWVSWLMVWDEGKIVSISKSMGHSAKVLQDFYLGLGFVKIEKDSIKKKMAGWGEA